LPEASTAAFFVQPASGVFIDEDEEAFKAEVARRRSPPLFQTQPEISVRQIARLRQCHKL
jgi:hypothetical protein